MHISSSSLGKSKEGKKKITRGSEKFGAGRYYAVSSFLWKSISIIISTEIYLHIYKAALDQQISIYEFSSPKEIPLKIILSLWLRKRILDIQGEPSLLQMEPIALWALRTRHRKLMTTIFLNQNLFIWKAYNSVPGFFLMEMIATLSPLNSLFLHLLQSLFPSLE